MTPTPPPHPLTPQQWARIQTRKKESYAVRTKSAAENVWNFAIFPQPVAQANCGSSVAGVVDLGEDVTIHLFVQDDVTLVKHAASCA